MAWKITRKQKKMPQLNRPILIEGLPGIGNVGKVAVDFMIDELKAKKVAEFYSHSFPHSVFVNDRNLVELPVIELYAVTTRGKKPDLLFLAGDIQPIDEVSCHEFSNLMLAYAKELGTGQLITIGGIGLPNVPAHPKVYCTSNSASFLKSFIAGTKLKKHLFGVVGPIIGVTGLMVGLASQYGMDAACLLAETYGHPLYLGMKGSQEVLKILNKKLQLGLDLKTLDKEISQLEQEMMRKTKQTSELRKGPFIRGKEKEATYIG